MMEYLGIRAVNDILVRDADDAYGDGMLRDGLADHCPQTTKLAMLLDSDDAASLTSSFEDSFSIERLDPRAVEDTSLDALLFQLQTSLPGMIDGLASGHDGDIAAIKDLNGLAHLEVKVIVSIDIRHSRTTHTNITRLIVIYEKLD